MCRVNHPSLTSLSPFISQVVKLARYSKRIHEYYCLSAHV
uniref:Uncharacterized protein n=1 Tax=Anguilla anguilla TaxID=7936 RepID=A0A0E9SM94_ANGAN